MRTIRKTYPLFFLFFFTGYIAAAQMMETEDGIPLEHHQFMGQFSGNYEKAKDERVLTFPLSVGYGFGERLTLELEPTLLTSFHLSDSTETGIGDMEAVLFYHILEEKKFRPLFTIGTEYKIPTAKNRLIGTGKADFTPMIIAGKTFGRFATYLNFRYTMIGKPMNISVNNFINWNAALVYTTENDNSLFAEVYGNSSAIRHIDSLHLSLPAKSILENAEFSGGEKVFSLGYTYHIHNGIVLSMAFSYNTSHSFLFSAGIVTETGKLKNKTGIWKKIMNVAKPN